MTAQEIKAILEKHTSIEDFAFGDFGPNDDFVASPEVEQIVNAKKEAEKIMEEHPLYKKPWNEQQLDTEFMALKDAYLELPSGYLEIKNEWLKSLGLGPIENVDRKGGEGEGEEWYVVFYFPKHNVYLKCNGYYQSYHGTEFYGGWNDCFEVIPKQVEITVYEKIKK
jgi:hypothetical protein